MLVVTSVLRVVHGDLRGRWFRVQAAEIRLYKALRINVFQRLLVASGWSRVVNHWRGFKGQKGDLHRLDQATRRSELTHLVPAGLALVLMVRAARGRAWMVFMSHFVLLVLLHVYPVALQRQLRARIQVLQERGC